MNQQKYGTCNFLELPWRRYLLCSFLESFVEEEARKRISPLPKKKINEEESLLYGIYSSAGKK